MQRGKEAGAIATGGVGFARATWPRSNCIGASAHSLSDSDTRNTLDIRFRLWYYVNFQLTTVGWLRGLEPGPRP